MATKKPIETAPEEQIEAALNKTEMFIQKNGKLLLTILIVAVVAVGGLYGYKHLYKIPRAEAASVALFTPQSQFEIDSIEVALNGIDGAFVGFDGVISDYSGTQQATLAAQYAGICAMRTGDFAAAIKYLEDYSSDGTSIGKTLEAQNKALLGDCNAELGNLAEAAKLYKKAAELSGADFIAVRYNEKAAMAQFESGDVNGALEFLKGLPTKTPALTRLIANFSQAI